MATDRTRDYSNILNGGQTILNETQTNIALNIKGNSSQTANILVIEPDGGEINGFDENGDLIRGSTPLIKKVSGSLPIGRAVFFTGSSWELANSSDEDSLGTHIVIETGLTGGMMRVQQGGYASVFSNLTPGDTYYVSTSGDLTSIKPTDVGDFVNPILVAETASSGWIVNHSSSEILAAPDDLSGDFLVRNPTSTYDNTVTPSNNSVVPLTVTHSGSSSTKLFEARDNGSYGVATIGRSSTGNFYFQVGDASGSGYGCVMTGNGRLAARSSARSAAGLSTGCLSSNPDSNMIGLIINADSSPNADYIVCNSSGGHNHFNLSSRGNLSINPNNGSRGIYIHSGGGSADYINCSGEFVVYHNGGIYSAATLTGIDSSAGRLGTRYGTNAVSFEWASGSGNLYGRINNGQMSMVIGSTSDYRVKNEQRAYDSGIEDLKLFRPIVYTIKTEEEIETAQNFKNTDFHRLKNKKGIELPGGDKSDLAGARQVYTKDVAQEQIGMLAHEVKDIIPSLVYRDKDEVNEKGELQLQSIDYAKITPILIQAVQELVARVEILENA